MTQWRIDPQDVQTVLNEVGTAQGAIFTVLGEETMTGIVGGLAWGGGVTSIVPEAVAALLGDQQADITNIGNRIGAGVQGVANATIAYNQGNETMAAQFQTEMSNSAIDGDFTFFEQHGYKG